MLLLLLCVTDAIAEESPRFDHAAYEAEMRERIVEYLAKTDPELPDYTPAGKVEGRIETLGKAELNNILTLVGDRFRSHYPEVGIGIEGNGGSTAPAELYINTISFGSMTRKYNERELTPFVEKYGYEPTYFLVTRDVLAIWVHKDNPIESLTLAQLDAMFSAERRRGHPEAITTWGQLGLDGEWSDRPIKLHGRSLGSGTLDCFVRTVLEGAQTKEGCISHPGSSISVAAVAADPAAVGFTSIGYGSEGVRAVPIVTTPGRPAVVPSFAAVSEGRYPLGRPFYLVINQKPGEPLDPLRTEFLRFLYSRQGQVMIAMDGYSPLPAEVAKRQLQQVGLEP